MAETEASTIELTILPATNKGSCPRVSVIRKIVAIQPTRFFAIRFSGRRIGYKALETRGVALQCKRHAGRGKFFIREICFSKICFPLTKTRHVII